LLVFGICVIFRLRIFKRGITIMNYNYLSEVCGFLPNHFVTVWLRTAKINCSLSKIGLMCKLYL
jgi:hypothetical protein